jgi:hypothetical protein
VNETLAFLRSLFLGTHEIRILGGTQVIAGRYSDPELAAQHIHEYQGAYRGIYVTLNPLNLEPTNRLVPSTHTATDADVKSLNYLFCDVDPTRAKDFKGYCATEQERQEAVGPDRWKWTAEAVVTSSTGSMWIHGTR